MENHKALSFLETRVLVTDMFMCVNHYSRPIMMIISRTTGRNLVGWCSLELLARGLSIEHHMRTISLGLSASIPLSSTIIQLSLTVLLPLTAGLWLRSKSYHQIIADNVPVSAVSQWMLLLIIFSTFCDMFRSAALESMITRVFTAAFIVCTMQIILLYLSWWTSQQWLRGYFSRKDTAAVMFCSTHKSLTLGLPILRIMVANVSVLGELALPLLLHHPLQMVLGALLVPSMTNWLHREKRTRIFSADIT
ncbi:unnamed protein product, partial [Meganyctiphanes norvegica]